MDSETASPDTPRYPKATSQKELKETFDEDASLYDRSRPHIL
jgi:hypothetical protein